MNTENFNIMIKGLKTLEEEDFYYGKVVSKRKLDNSKLGWCGSVCCVIGWTPRFFPSIEWCGGELPLGKNLSINGVPAEFEDVAIKLFDISSGHAYGLFAPKRQHYLPFKTGNLGNEAELGEVIRLLDKYIEYNKDKKLN